MNKGFTLLQIILVVSLISILAGFMAFQFSAVIDQIKLTAVAKTIAQDLRAAQIRAQSTHNLQQLVFESTSYSSQGIIKKIPSPVEVATPQTIRFAATGLPQPGYFGSLTLVCRGKTKLIIISPAGRVRIE
jgi:type II secretory pathway pseudopilin PulG